MCIYISSPFTTSAVSLRPYRYYTNNISITNYHILIFEIKVITKDFVGTLFVGIIAVTF